MKIENFQIPKSSFLSIDKDTDLIISKMLKNERLKRLLHWNTKDCITNTSGKCPNLTEEESLALIGKEIRLVPRLALDNSVLNYIIITFNNFSPNETNPEFRDNVIEFHIVCHYDQWHIADGQLRPYRIAAEIDSMFDKKHLSGIGTLQFIGANQTVVNDDYAGLTLFYYAIHGEEDKKDMLSESADVQFKKEFNEMWNS